MEALFSRAARLFTIEFVEPPAVTARRRRPAFSRCPYGPGQVDGIVERIRGELGTEARAIGTGGLADLIAPHARTIDVDPLPDAGRAPSGLGTEPALMR